MDRTRIANVSPHGNSFTKHIQQKYYMHINPFEISPKCIQANNNETDFECEHEKIIIRKKKEDSTIITKNKGKRAPSRV